MEEETAPQIALRTETFAADRTYLTVKLPGYEELFTRLGPGTTLAERLPDVRFHQVGEYTVGLVTVTYVFDRQQMAELCRHLELSPAKE